MTSVTIWWVRRFFTCAKIDGFVFDCFKLMGSKFCSFVCAVTERLFTRQSASTPRIFCSLCYVDSDRCCSSTPRKVTVIRFWNRIQIDIWNRVCRTVLTIYSCFFLVIVRYHHCSPLLFSRYIGLLFSKKRQAGSFIAKSAIVRELLGFVSEWSEGVLYATLVYCAPCQIYSPNRGMGYFQERRYRRNSALIRYQSLTVIPHHISLQGEVLSLLAMECV